MVEAAVEPPPRRAAHKAAKPPAAAAASGFAQMGLSEVMLEALDAAGYIEPTPVQAGLIPRAWPAST